jgi:hypothetical protein
MRQSNLLRSLIEAGVDDYLFRRTMQADCASLRFFVHAEFRPLRVGGGKGLLVNCPLLERGITGWLAS